MRLNVEALETAIDHVRAKNLSTLNGAIAEGISKYLSASIPAEIAKSFEALQAELETVKAEYAEFVKQHEKEVGAEPAGKVVYVGPDDLIVIDWIDSGAVRVGSLIYTAPCRPVTTDAVSEIYHLRAELETVKVSPAEIYKVLCAYRHRYPTEFVDHLGALSRELSALTRAAPTHEDGSGETADPEECERTAAFWGAEATKAMLQGDGDEAKRCLSRSKRHALNAVRIRAIASGGKP